MKKATWLMLGVVVVLMFGGEVYAQQRSLEGPAVSYRSVDGSSSQVLHSGIYKIVSLVGQPVVGSLSSRSGSIWRLHGKLNASQELASLSQALEVPTDFALEANYPNPFNPETTIRFALPVASHVLIEVYDVLGREVARLVDGEMGAGHHTVVFEGRSLASGIYIYRMFSGSFEQYRTMLLVK